MANVNDDDTETLNFADESEYAEDEPNWLDYDYDLIAEELAQ